MHWDVSQLVGGRKSGAGVEVGKEQGGLGRGNPGVRRWVLSVDWSLVIAC